MNQLAAAVLVTEAAVKNVGLYVYIFEYIKIWNHIGPTGKCLVCQFTGPALANS